ncbi:Protein ACCUMULATION AND REPLICATION OF CHLOROPLASTS 3 [Striga hermonthica]|uniref:Protein ACCUMULATION AND REPLICATION OF CHLOROPLASTS 3 n=1 Tax=Striga hermonthica TaxID=68872 RepID=A0A9N7MQR4_STRHE|nr:Protein ACCUMULATION AND REPLICATION OF CHLOROPLASTS 3 [Striga hermonthica]
MTLPCPNTPVSLSRSPVFLSSLSFVSPRETRPKHGPSPLLWNSSSISVKLSCACLAACDEINNVRNNGGGDASQECEECVEVMVVGSRRDAVLDFCSGSPFLSPVLRFWNILGADTEKMQLQQKSISPGITPRTVDDFLPWQSSHKAVILVASAAYGSEHVTALEVLSNVKSGNGFVVGIILKPFRFEGRRRQDEVKDLLEKVKKQANFCIVLDTDALLENDLVTLDEALKTSNNAVLMAMNTISILLSEEHIKLLNTKDNLTRELQLHEFREIFASYTEARIGFGSGYNVKISLLQAIKDCPFLGVDVKELNGVLLCIIASSGAMDCSDADVLRTVREITKCNGEIILSVVRESNLEANTILATIIVFGYTTQQLAPRKGILFSLGQHFPFIFNIFKKQHQRTVNSGKAFLFESPDVSDVISPVAGGLPIPESLVSSTFEGTNVSSGKIPQLLGEADGEFFSLRDDSSSRESGVESFGANSDSSIYKLNSEGTQVFNRELRTRGNMEPVYLNKRSKGGTNFSEVAIVDSVSIYKLPVGVKNLEKLEETPHSSNTKEGVAWRIDDNKTDQARAWPGSSMPWSGLIDADQNKNVPSLSTQNATSNYKQQGVLSSRAASMLESERDSQNKWSRVVEMKYRGGIYRGRIQGGLPEGKGRLLLGNGSIYDGMWRYGKRSGLGTYYFNSGDVFQGSWRDDVMHGKGWIYFHTGDRWFVNFWKGKANGEGRFYSKLGDVFFGHFKEGWRHGHFLRINVHGTRSEELWDEGVLVSETTLDPDAEIG